MPRADFGSGIDAGFSSSLSGNGSASVVGGKLQLRSPANADAAIIRCDTGLAHGWAGTITVRGTINSLGSAGYSYGLCLSHLASNYPTNNGSQPPDYQDIAIVGSHTTNEVLITYVDNAVLNKYWNGTIWTTPVWITLARDTEYKFVFESDGTQWRVRILLASNDSVVYSTSYVLWSGTVNRGAGRSFWAWAGEQYYHAYVGSMDIEYFYVDPQVNPPGAVQSLVSTGQVNKIALTWSAPVSGDAPTGYKVYFSINGSSYSLVSTQAGTGYTHRRAGSGALQSIRVNYGSWIGLQKGTNYWYKVVAYNTGGDGPETVTGPTQPVADSAYVGGTTRAKMVVNLIAWSSDHSALYRTTKAQLETMHDWVRANFTTKITLCVSREILFSTPNPSGTEAEKIIAYLQSLVTAYGYDIVTLPHLAWYPNNPDWTLGIVAEQARIQDCHDQCFVRFGKYPVTSFAWHYNHDMMDKAASLGYTILPHPITELSAIDAHTIMGAPWGPYLPSKRNTVLTGGSDPAKLYSVPSAYYVLRWVAYELIAANTGSCAMNGDLWSNLFAQQRSYSQILEDSQAVTFNTFHMTNVYLDPYWTFLDSHQVTLPEGETEMWYQQKALMTWYKDRYDGITDYMSASEYATYVNTLVNASDPSPAHALLTYNEQEDTSANSLSDNKGVRYDCKTYHAMVNHKAGTSGYVRLVQYVPQSPDVDEVNSPANDWSPDTGVLRTAASRPVAFSFVAGGTTYNLNTPSGGANVHAPTHSVSGKTLTTDIDIYNAANDTRLITLRLVFSETYFRWEWINRHASVTSVTDTTTVLSSYVAPHGSLHPEPFVGGQKFSATVIR